MKYHVCIDDKKIASFVSVKHRDAFYDMIKEGDIQGQLSKKDDQTWP